MSEIHERALSYCRELTASEFAFTGLLVDGPRVMDVAAISGFKPVDQQFYDQFHKMTLRSSVVGVTIKEQRPNIANDVAHDPHSVGFPQGHPPVRKFLGVPLLVGAKMIGMIGVANKTEGYGVDDERLLSTLANQVAVAIENARLYEQQGKMIASLEQLHDRLSDAERTHLLDHERERIAGDLHDRIEQEIFSIGLGINSLLEVDAIDTSMAEQLRATRQLVVAVADEVRKVIFALAVPGRGSHNLSSGVQSMLRDLERRSVVKGHLVVSGKAPSGLEWVSDVLYSVINEALANVERHAEAQAALVSIRYEDDRVDVVVQDDGAGVSELVLLTFQDSYLHYGLRHMREQIVSLGGTFEIVQGEENGTIVRLSVPVPATTT
ncbi:MAG TPA: GAF domain-containing protein [Acidimicrobiales bacterium]|jgi:signal transduction histidine kinase|nr:GAF domain-containing protein [Acidimicrobiales bacterium]